MCAKRERVGEIVRNLEAANQDVTKEVMELVSQKSVSVCKEREKERQTDRQTDRQIDRQLDILSVTWRLPIRMLPKSWLVMCVYECVCV